MQRVLLVVLVLVLAGAAFLFLRGGDAGPAIATPDAAPAAAAADPATQQAAAAAKTASQQRGEQPAQRAVAGERAVRFHIRGRFEEDPRLPIFGAVVRVVDRDAADGKRTARGPFGDAYSGLMPIAADARDRGRAPVDRDGSFDVEVRSVGQNPVLTVQLDHDHYLLPSAPPIPIGDGQSDIDLGSLRPLLGALVIGRLLDFTASASADVILVAEADMMAPARDPLLFAAQMASNQRAPVKAADDGQFRLRALAPCPTACVRAESGDQVGSSAHFGLSAGETREVTIPAQAAATVMVTVRDAAGAAASGAEVTISATAGVLTAQAASRHGTTDAAGGVRLRGLPAGEVRVEIRQAGLASLRERKTLVAGEQSLTFTLSLGATAQGRVENEQGEAIAAARIASQPSQTVPMFGDMASMVGADALASAADNAPCRSDAEGRFTLTGLPSDGAVMLIVAHDDYAPKTESNVKAGRKDLRVVLQRRAEVVGRVLDAGTGKPLSAFGVEALTSGMMGMEMPVRSEHLQDVADGRFALQLSPARLTLRITAPGFGVTDQKVQAAAGARVDVGDIALQAAASIAGRVVDEQGAAIAGARVRVRRGGMLDHEIFAQMRGTTTATCTTDVAGVFVLHDVTPGKVRLMATHRAFAAGESTRLEIAPGQSHRDVVLTLDHGGSIAGRLLLAPGARVSDWDVYAGDARGGNVHNADLGGDGTFHIENVAPGTYNVQAMNSAGFVSAMAESGVGNSEGPNMAAMMKSIAKHMVQAQCSVKRAEVTHVDLDASALDAGGATLQCEVLVGDEHLNDGFLEVRGAGEGGRIVAIDKGRAEVTGLQPGPVSLQVRAGLGFAAIGEPQTTTIARADQEQQFTLRLSGALLAGRVVDADSGEPIRGATVRARRVDAVASAASEFGFALTDASGQFRFRGLAPGTYNVVADEFLSSDPQRASGRIEGLALGASERRENLVLRARRGAQVAVTVRDAGGQPVPQAMVLLVDADGQPAATLPIAVTDGDGRADLAGLPDGSLRAVARVPYLAPGVSTASRATSGSEVRLEVTLNPGPAVTLRVEDARGQPLAGYQVAVKLGTTADAPWLSSQMLGVTGIRADTDLGVMPSGTLRLRIQPAHGAAFEVERSVPAGRRAALTVTAPR